MIDPQTVAFLRGTFDSNSDNNGSHSKLVMATIGQGGLGFSGTVPFPPGTYPAGTGGMGTIILPTTDNRPPVDADFYLPIDGMMVYDRTTCKLYIRALNGSWPSIGLA